MPTSQSLLIIPPGRGQLMTDKTPGWQRHTFHAAGDAWTPAVICFRFRLALDLSTSRVSLSTCYHINEHFPLHNVTGKPSKTMNVKSRAQHLAFRLENRLGEDCISLTMAWARFQSSWTCLQVMSWGGLGLRAMTTTETLLLMLIIITIFGDSSLHRHYKELHHLMFPTTLWKLRIREFKSVPLKFQCSKESS